MSVRDRLQAAADRIRYERSLGMHSVEVQKAELLTVVIKNKGEHRAVFLAAQDKYRQAVIAELEAMLAEARRGERVRRAVQLQAPVDHTRDYDRVIAMLTMSVEDTISLRSEEFESYVMDRWPWAQQFASNSLSYGVASKYGAGEDDDQ